MMILLGQAHQIDGTPSPWVCDVWSILGIKLAIEKIDDSKITQKFIGWSKGFLPQLLRDNRLDSHERTIADYILGNILTPDSNSSMALFFHFQGKQIIYDALSKARHVENFLNEFKNSYTNNFSAPVLGVLVYVFDKLNEESALVPPNSWHLDDLIKFLENIPTGLRRWTWEDQSRTSGGNTVRWKIENEYHVQNLLYLLLAPIFIDITDENYTAPVGPKNPRIDLYLPSSHTIIEVKYRKDSKKTFASLIGEVAEDASLYKADSKFENCKLVIFLWDNNRSTEQHLKFKEGVLKISGINGCVVISAPSMM